MSDHKPHKANLEAIKDLQRRRQPARRPAHKTQPDKRVQKAALAIIATGIGTTKAVEHLEEQLQSIGFRSTATGGPQRLVEHDPEDPDLDMTGDSALHAINLDRLQRRLDDGLVDIGSKIVAHATLIASITRSPEPFGMDGVALCSDNQHGRDGVDVWGDSGCNAVPVRHNLCWGHYQKERRWRVSNELPRRAIEEPAE
jgi:hypothetical protein